MPLLFITQLNAGIYMVFGGPYVNRLFDAGLKSDGSPQYLSASVLITRQIISIIYLLAIGILTKKINLSLATWKDWKFTILCGKTLQR
jgi:hypothetical protein